MTAGRGLSKEKISSPLYWRNQNFNAPNQPVVNVSWYEADAFSRWAGGQLPTEQQWEAAARGPGGGEYPWGNAWEDGICNSREAGLGSPSAVGIFPRSRSVELGLDDMSGNVFEWCADQGAANDASGRVGRGGGWSGDSVSCRAACRRWGGPQNRNVHLGFRVAAVPVGGAVQKPERAEPVAKARTKRGGAAK